MSINTKKGERTLCNSRNNGWRPRSPDPLGRAPSHARTGK